jgi:DNA polymerase elongation subunit (family B)
MEDVKNMTDVELLELQKKLYLDINKYQINQLARKLQLNSCYGALGSPYFRFYNIQTAEAITLTGQMTIQWIATRLNEYLNKVAETSGVDYVIASDTDSVYISVNNIVKKYCDAEDITKIVEYVDDISKNAIEPFIKNKLNVLAKQLNVDDNRVVMAREVIANRGVWSAKKQYMLNVLDSEGVRYKKEEQKFVGLETNRSSTPEVIREELKKCAAIILNGSESELKKEIKSFRERYMSLDLNMIAFPRSVSDLEKYSDPFTIYKLRTPIAVKAALLYNHYIKEFKIDDKHAEIKEGEKIKFLFLKQPNPLSGKKQEDCVIGYSAYLPKEFNIEKYVDRETQFKKSFLKPIHRIMDIIGWRYGETRAIEELF